jgi:hypothetical protein
MTKNIFLPEIEYNKCAPSKTFSEGSCFNIQSLTKIAKAYNNYTHKANDKITITDSKKSLVKQLINKISDCGNDQLCWLDKKWIKDLEDEEINNNTFRPMGPQGRFKWLSTTDINNVIEQYENKYKDFKFLGAVPRDFDKLDQLNIRSLNFDNLINQGISKIGIVFNLDKHTQKGSHWVSMFSDLKNDKIYFFDSAGENPKDEITELVKRIALWCYKRHKLNIKKHNDIDIDTESKFMRSTNNKYEKMMDIKYNNIRHQFKNSECGVYSINFILRLLKGESFNDICNNVTYDDKMNECRKTYFRFK